MVFSNFEETGIPFGGATVAGYSIDPDYALVADVTGAVIPGSENKIPKMGEGPTITLAPITDRRMSKMLIKAAEEKDIKLHIEVAAGRTGTNTTALNRVREGVPTVDIGLPLKNMHTYTEIIDLADCRALASLVRAFVTSKKIAEVFGK